MMVSTYILLVWTFSLTVYYTLYVTFLHFVMDYFVSSCGFPSKTPTTLFSTATLSPLHFITLLLSGKIRNVFYEGSHPYVCMDMRKGMKKWRWSIKSELVQCRFSGHSIIITYPLPFLLRMRTGAREHRKVEPGRLFLNDDAMIIMVIISKAVMTTLQLVPQESLWK